MSGNSTLSTIINPQTRAVRASRWIIRMVLPVGWLALLTGLFWIGDRSLFHKLYYALIAIPALIALIMQPTLSARLLRHPILIAYIAFASYMTLTLLWTDSDTSAQSLIKRPIYVLVLLLSAALLASERPQLLSRTLRAAGVAAAISGALSYGYFLYNGHGIVGNERFSGYGTLYNPLLSAHVYGFFAAFWLASWFTGREPSATPLICLALLGVVIVATGSRTPLLALSTTALWLCMLNVNRRSLIVFVIGLALGAGLLYLYPSAIMSRGLSYRPDIWIEALKLANEQPLFGYGYEHELLLELKGSKLIFNDPHNIELAVLLAGGLVGLVLWTVLYTIALGYSWRNRSNPEVVIASALLIFGLVAGLTEGRDFLSRPKEHWFLIWIPFALTINAWIGASSGKGNGLESSQRV